MMSCGREGGDSRLTAKRLLATSARTVVRKIVQNLSARCDMNLFRVFHPYGVEHGCVSPQSRTEDRDSVRDYRFQYPEPQAKEDEAAWRETPTSGAGPLCTITSSELVVRQWLRWRDFSKQRATRLPARTRTYTRQCRPG